MPVEEVPSIPTPGEVPRGPVPLERLEAEITELAGHLRAGESRFLTLVAEFDRRKGHEAWGCRTAAQWLAWQCGLDRRAAREKVRVARALEVLPAITERFAAGALSYSKVRALTRIATPANEADLAPLAEEATAVQVERIVRAYRGVVSADDGRELANEQHAARYLRIDPDDDGTFVINGRIPADLAAIVLTAIEAARAQLPTDPCGESGPAGPPFSGASSTDDPAGGRTGNAAGTESGPAGPLSEGVPLVPGREDSGVSPTSVAATNVDALVMMAETLLAHRPAARKGGDRYQIVVNVDADVLVEGAEGAEGGRCELDDGSHLAPEIVRRLMCDASQVFVLHDEHGRPVDISNKARSIPPSLRRSVHARDQGCRFPGCGERSFVDVHHIRHRAHGGANDLANLIQLCWFHHRLVHEGGWNVRLDPDGTVHAVQPNGAPLPRRTGAADPTPAAGATGDTRGIETRNRARGITIDGLTCVSHNETVELNHVVSSLICLDDTSFHPVLAPARGPEPRPDDREPDDRGDGNHAGLG